MKSIYDNISDKQFIGLKNKLRKIEKDLSQFCNTENIRIDKERYYDVSLAINFYKTEDEFNYHSSLFCDKGKSFSFSFMKYIDEKDKRIFKKEILIENNPIDFYTKEILIDLLSNSLNVSRKWELTDLTEKVEFTPPPEY